MKRKFRIKQFIKSDLKEFSEKWGIQIHCDPSINNAARDGFQWVKGWVFETKEQAEEKLRKWGESK